MSAFQFKIRARHEINHRIKLEKNVIIGINYAYGSRLIMQLLITLI